jgi:hypothetical protein
MPPGWACMGAPGIPKNRVPIACKCPRTGSTSTCDIWVEGNTPKRARPGNGDRALIPLHRRSEVNAPNRACGSPRGCPPVVCRNRRPRPNGTRCQFICLPLLPTVTPKLHQQALSIGHQAACARPQDRVRSLSDRRYANYP